MKGRPLSLQFEVEQRYFNARQIPFCDRRWLVKLTGKVSILILVSVHPVIIPVSPLSLLGVCRSDYTTHITRSPESYLATYRHQVLCYKLSNLNKLVIRARRSLEAVLVLNPQLRTRRH